MWDRNVTFYFESYKPPKKESDPMMKFWADKLLSLAVQQPDIVKDALLEIQREGGKRCIDQHGLD